MTTWTLTAYELPLRFLWKLSRNTSAAKTNFVLQATQAGASGRGEAAPNVRYGETPALLRAQFEDLLAHGLPQASTPSRPHGAAGHPARGPRPALCPGSRPHPLPGGAGGAAGVAVAGRARAGPARGHRLHAAHYGAGRGGRIYPRPARRAL